MVAPSQLKTFKVIKRKFGSRIYQSILQAMRDIYAELEDRDRHEIVEEELLASPSPVCDRCTVLKEKVITLQKQIDWLKRSRNMLRKV